MKRLYIGAIVFFLSLNAITTTSTYADNTQIQPTLEVKAQEQRITVHEDMRIQSEVKVDAEELELLAHLIYAENGASTMADEVLYLTGAVVLNRVASDYYPNTIRDVIYQHRQYACTWDGGINKQPSERAYRIALELLIDGVNNVPANVLYQAEFKQGSGVYKELQGTYFCYR